MTIELNPEFTPRTGDRRQRDGMVPVLLDRRNPEYDYHADNILLRTMGIRLNLDDNFDHWQGQPQEGNEDMVQLAWQTHAAGYLRTGLAKEAAIQDGVLSPVIDKSRHRIEGITYYLATNPYDSAERSTARLIDSPSIEALPTFSLTGANMSHEGREHLESALGAGVQLRELGALANSKNGYCRGASEVLRKIVQDTITDSEGNKQVLFCSMVEGARKGLAHTLSEATLVQVGSPTVLPENAYRKETTLVPVVIDPNMLISNILNAYRQSSKLGERRRFLESALFFAEPLSPDVVPEELVEIRAKLGREAIHSVELGGN